MRILTEETFGPVLPIMLFDIEGEAILLPTAQTTAWRQRLDQQPRPRQATARRLRAGTVMVNDSIPPAISEARTAAPGTAASGPHPGRLWHEEMDASNMLTPTAFPR